MQHFPLEIPKDGLSPDKGEELFEEIKTRVEKTLPRKYGEYAWIRPGTWALINECAKLRRLDRLTQAKGWRLSQRIYDALRRGIIERARKAGEGIMAHLIKGNAKEAWRILRVWYRITKGKAAKPCYHQMEKQTMEQEALYDYVPPPV